MKQKLKIRLMSMLAVLAAAAGSGLSCASPGDGAGDILPSGSLVRNGDFENGLEAFTPHLLPGARGRHRAGRVRIRLAPDRVSPRGTV